MDIVASVFHKILRPVFEGILKKIHHERIGFSAYWLLDDASENFNHFRYPDMTRRKMDNPGLIHDVCIHVSSQLGSSVNQVKYV